MLGVSEVAEKELNRVIAERENARKKRDNRQKCINNGICPDCGSKLSHRDVRFWEKFVGGVGDWEKICKKCGVVDRGCYLTML